MVNNSSIINNTNTHINPPNIKKNTTYDVGNAGPVLEKAFLYCVDS